MHTFKLFKGEAKEIDEVMLVHVQHDELCDLGGTTAPLALQSTLGGGGGLSPKAPDDQR
jgi:hypothetical protein